LEAGAGREWSVLEDGPLGLPKCVCLPRELCPALSTEVFNIGGVVEVYARAQTDGRFELPLGDKLGDALPRDSENASGAGRRDVRNDERRAAGETLRGSSALLGRMAHEKTPAPRLYAKCMKGDSAGERCL